jgi:hypothetical protein
VFSTFFFFHHRNKLSSESRGSHLGRNLTATGYIFNWEPSKNPDYSCTIVFSTFFFFHHRNKLSSERTAELEKENRELKKKIKDLQEEIEKMKIKATYSADEKVEISRFFQLGTIQESRLFLSSNFREEDFLITFLLFTIINKKCEIDHIKTIQSNMYLTKEK